jgi:hypothetical protein
MRFIITPPPDVVVPSESLRRARSWLLWLLRTDRSRRAGFGSLMITFGQNILVHAKQIVGVVDPLDPS